MATNWVLGLVGTKTCISMKFVKVFIHSYKNIDVVNQKCSWLLDWMMNLTPYMVTISVNLGLMMSALNVFCMWSEIVTLQVKEVAIEMCKTCDIFKGWTWSRGVKSANTIMGMYWFLQKISLWSIGIMHHMLLYYCWSSFYVPAERKMGHGLVYVLLLWLEWNVS